MWATTGWWNSANALTAVIGYTQCTGDNTYAGIIERSFKRARRRHQGFTNSDYDDNAWWALAWAAAYDLTRDRRYLQAAQSIFDHNTAGWDDTCGGGLWWHEGYENTSSVASGRQDPVWRAVIVTIYRGLNPRGPTLSQGVQGGGERPFPGQDGSWWASA